MMKCSGRISFVIGSIFLVLATPDAGFAQFQCFDCHGSRSPVDFRPLDAAYRNITTGGFPGNHRRHIAAPGNPASCEVCHPGSASYTNIHRDGLIQVSPNINASPGIGRYNNSIAAFPQTPTPTLGTCANINCHFETVTPQWGSQPFGSASDCAKCHAAPPVDGSHAIHDLFYGPGASSCGRCHADHAGESSPFAHATSAGRRSLVLKGFSYSKPGNIGYPRYLPSQTPASARNGVCSTITCHGNTSAAWGSGSACLDCHSVVQGNRAAIAPQFGANSHHIQGTVTNAHCYQCHWEANSDGSINRTYHHAGTPGGPVELVIYGAGSRPVAYSAGVTAIQYTGNGSRTEMQKLNSHCLGCHSDQNNATMPFGDGKTPRQYAWDGTSVAARYGQTATTTWGKYSTVTNAAQKRMSKAYSAHGNAAGNKRGWNSATGVDGAIADTSGGVNVLCYDCHNSHGSTATGTTTRYASATANGGILKNTIAGQGGYAVSYRPYTGGSALTKDLRNPGASLCLDCHQKQTAATTPWGYSATFGAQQPVLGYWDSPFMGYSTSGAEQRFPFKKRNSTKGGHFGASLSLSTSPMGSIDGLCTPCHDPHGVSPTLGSNQQYAVPLLKGTWVTSPYKEDTPPGSNAWLTNFAGYGEGVQYHIDQNTFGSGIRGTVAGMTQTVEQSSGLCLGCHPKSSLTAAATPASPNPWLSKNRVHEAVKGWKSSDSTVQHTYSCSKCHSAHTNSFLPRLMVTNCLDSRHKGRTGYNTAPVVSGSSSGDGGSGSGRVPGSYSGDGWEGFGDGLPGLWAPGDVGVACHESSTANGYGADGTNQQWNTVTPWIDTSPAILSGPTASSGGLRLFMHMDEAAWNGTANEVEDSSGGENNGTAYSGATTVAGGISGRAGSFNNSFVTVNYASGIPPVDSFTIEAWIKPTTTHQIDTESNVGTSGTSGQKYLFKPDQRGPANGGAGVSAGTNGISVYEHGDSYLAPLAVYSGTISSSQWTHLAVVYTNKKPSIYLNGSLVRTGLQSPRAHVYAPQAIGAGDYGYYSGLADEVVMYDRPLSAAEILSHSQQDYTDLCSSAEATISWTTNLNSDSAVDYGLTASYGLTAGSDQLVTSHSVQLTNLVSQAEYHYRVRSRSVAGVETVSGDNLFLMGFCSSVSVTPPPAPILTGQPTGYVIGTGATAGITFGWSGVTAPDGDAVQYLAEVSSSASFATTAYSSSWQSGTSWTQALPAGTWYWRIKARDSIHTTAVSTSAMNSFGVVDRTPAVPTLIHNEGAGTNGATIAFQWNAVASPDGDTVQYFVEVSDSSGFSTILYGTPSWQTGTGWSQAMPVGTYYWRVRARDSVHATAVSNNSATDSFSIAATTSQTWSTPGSYTYVVPAGVTTITAKVYGGGGAGGLEDNVYNQEAGANGAYVSTPIAVTPGAQLTIHVASGGSPASMYDTTPGAGGSGYHTGGTGTFGEGNAEAYAYGGSGGGGSSAVTLSTTLLAEAAGGAGGRSSDYDDYEYCYESSCSFYYGGIGGAGGGSNYPAVTTAGGGGAGGAYGQAGSSGSVTIVW